MVVQRREAQAAQRGAFGFSLPSLAIFDRLGSKDGDRDEKRAARATPDPDGAIRDEKGQLQAIVTTLKSAARDPLDKWVFVLSDGAVWRQTDNEQLAPRPKAGEAVEVRRAALGSFVLELKGRPPVRVKRSE